MTSDDPTPADNAETVPSSDDDIDDARETEDEVAQTVSKPSPDDD